MAFSNRGDQAHAKDDTRLLLEWGVSATADLSQRATNLTSFLGGSYEAPSARTAVASPREITAQFSVDNADSGYLVNHGNTGGTTYYRMRVDGSGNLICEDDVNGSIFGSVALPGVDATADQFTAQWCTTHNRVLTTGASDAVRHELFIYNHTDSSWHLQQATSAAHTPSASDSFTANGLWNGATITNAMSAGSSIHWIRVGVRFHSTTEANEEWVSATSAPSNDGESRVQEAPLPVRMGEDSEFAGPQYLYAARAHNRNTLRLLSNLVNMACQAPPTYEDDIKDQVNDSWVGNPSGSTTHQTHIGFLRHLPLPPTCNRARVRVNVQLWDTVATPDTLDIRCYSSNTRPGLTVPWQEKTNYVEMAHSTDDGATGPGSWSAATTHLTLNRDPFGWTWLYLSFETNGGTPSATNRFKVWSWVVDPILVIADDEDPGQGIELPP